MMGEDRPASKRISGGGGYEPVLGLSDEPGGQVAVPSRRGWAVGTVYDQPEPEWLIELTVVVPARNEQDCLGECQIGRASCRERV